MAAHDDERRPDTTDHRLPQGAERSGDGISTGDVGTATAPERVSIDGIADKVKGLLRSRD